MLSFYSSENPFIGVTVYLNFFSHYLNDKRTRVVANSILDCFRSFKSIDDFRSIWTALKRVYAFQMIFLSNFARNIIYLQHKQK